MNPRAVLYARVSGDDRQNEGRNLAGQLALCREYARAHGYEVVAELSEDDRGASGAAFELPQLAELRRMAEQQAFDVLVVRDLDRLSRNLAKQLFIEEALRRGGVRVEFALAAYPATAEGNLMKNLRAAVAEYERLKIRERVARGRRQLLQDGSVILPAGPPYGYDLVQVEGRQMLAVNEDEARAVRQIYAWYTAGDGPAGPLSIYAIQRRLTADHVPSYDDLHGRPDRKKRGRGEWSGSVIGRMLRDETYAGVWTYRAKSGDGAPAAAETLAVAVPAIVSRATWEQAQARRAARAHLGPWSKGSGHWLQGRRVCGLCGASIGAPSRSPSVWTERRYYHCPAAVNHVYHNYARPCTAPAFRAEVVDNLIWNWAQATLLDTATLGQGLAALRAERDTAQAPLRERHAALTQQLAAQQAAAERLLDQYLAGTITRDGLAAQTRALEQAGLALAWERDQLAAQLAAPLLDDAQLADLQACAAQVAERLAQAQADAQLQRLVVEALDVQVTLTLTGGRKMITIRSVLGETTQPVPDPLVLSPRWWRSVSAAGPRRAGGVV